MKTNRIVWVDIAKYVCIMCVMASHLETMTSPLRALFTPFFLSLFFFCSGYVFNIKDSFCVFFKKKFFQLFIPWLILSTLNIVLSQLLTFREHGDLGSELFWNFLQIRARGDGVWFVAALFVSFIPFYFIIKWYHKKQVSLRRTCHILIIVFSLLLLRQLYILLMEPRLLPWNSIALPWHIEYLFYAVFYMTLGYLFKTNFETKFDALNTLSFRIFLWAGFLCIVYLISISSNFNFWILFLLEHFSSLLGICAVISVCKVIKTNKYISYVGQNTLLYFALHGKAYSVIQTILKKLCSNFYAAILNNVLASSVFVIIFAFILSLILIIPTHIINQYFPFIVGRAYKKTSKG